MPKKSSAIKAAPPINPPSTSAPAKSSTALDALQLLSLIHIYPQQRGVPYGSFEKYYEDGQLMQIGQYDGWDKEYVFHFYDEKGNDVLVKGSGVFRQYKENLNNYVFYYTKDSALQYSYMIDEEFKDTIYCLLYTSRCV